jgi:hypothetical protein
MALVAKWEGQTGKVIHESVGRVLVDFGDARPRWLLLGIEGLIILEHKSRGRPAKFQSNAERQRSYRERKSGKALRKYTKQAD